MKVIQSSFHITGVSLLHENRKGFPDDNNKVYFKKFQYLNSGKLGYAGKDLCLFLGMIEGSDDYYYVVLQENGEFLLISGVGGFEIQKFKYEDEYLNQRLEFESYQEFYTKLKDSIFDFSYKKIEGNHNKQIDDYVTFIEEVQNYYQFVFRAIQERIKEKFGYTIDFTNCTIFYNSVKQYGRNIMHDKENLVLDII